MRVDTQKANTQKSDARLEVVVTDIKMPFGSMVAFMVMWMLASIPAMIILAFIGFIAMAVLGGIGAIFSNF